jgi:DNA-binding transcriptional ArsR family regulator
MSPRAPAGAAPKSRRSRPRTSAKSAAAERRRATQELRALAHPLRLRLLEEFAGAPRTTMQVAAAMGEPPTRLYHHVNALERAGILKLARTRQVRGTTEKYYEVAKKQIGAVQGEKLTPGMKAPIRNLAYMMFEEARADLFAAIADGAKITPDNAPVALRMLLTASPERLAGVRQKLLALLEAVQKECKGQPPPENALRWALTVSFAPRGKLAEE